MNALPKPYYEEEGITLFCADCREILPLLPDKSIDLVLTDPPYGMNLDASFKNSTPNPRKNIGASRGYDAIIGDADKFDFAGYFGLVDGVRE